MEERFFLLTVLLVTPALVSSQTTVPKAAQDHRRPMHLKRNQSAVTGCLMKNPHGEYVLVDEKGIHNLLYSSTVPLDTYLGQSVTVIGERGSTPTTDMGTARSLPYFKVVDLRPASGKCSR
jgi:hypothetical protein